MPVEREEKVLAVIPARYASTRFPGKPLVEIQGKPMIQHVWERACRIPLVDRVVVATDDERIAQAMAAVGGEVCMTRSDHPSGTDRIWEVASRYPEYDLVFNIQGDEPFIDPDVLNAVIQAMNNTPDAGIYTLVTPIHEEREWLDPNVVKAVLTAQGRALYFSRAAVPYHRDAAERANFKAYRHLGLYLYRRNLLERFTTLPPSALEQVEKLEQLRAMEDGMKIYAYEVANAPMGIDTPQDLETLLGSLRA